MKRCYKGQTPDVTGADKKNKVGENWTNSYLYIACYNNTRVKKILIEKILN